MADHNHVSGFFPNVENGVYLDHSSFSSPHLGNPRYITGRGHGVVHEQGDIGESPRAATDAFPFACTCAKSEGHGKGSGRFL